MKLLVPFTLHLHIFYAVFFNVVAVIKACSVRQIHEQTHFHLRKETKTVMRQTSGFVQFKTVTQNLGLRRDTYF